MKSRNELEGYSIHHAEARQQIDAVVADIQTQFNLDHREISSALLETRDTLLITGHVPEWFGDDETNRYAKMVRD